ncbi:hypothetical protein SAMN00768000_3097 [Sulfobacillus thermosulfidooxidans DSM 9293]|uniref:Uncharacterized protein n=1 Tax=Sulfobacillus thermosulfidooxidans (strain DSM 9293 / VKM B-1269 / AT-1) TaxID=929705 RepID=A0A1W1WL51_SULTA|nr:hypothetical protein [Sulfobacillus thermosulfidooxidans]SMC06909.1 hypothetical protein SAMN00768000_3097 [Sulfobacillus thermosulfidooxidans DSM 9293]
MTVGATGKLTGKYLGNQKVAWTFEGSAGSHTVEITLNPRPWSNEWCWITAADQILMQAIQQNFPNDISNIPTSINESQFPNAVTITCS